MTSNTTAPRLPPLRQTRCLLELGLLMLMYMLYQARSITENNLSIRRDEFPNDLQVLHNSHHHPSLRGAV